MPDELPKGWIRTTLGEIVEPSRDRALPMEFSTARYVGLEHIEPQSMRLVQYGYARDARSSALRFSKGDVLYGRMRPYLNKVWVAEFDGLCSAEFIVFPRREGLSSQFLGRRLNAEDFTTFANHQVSGERPRVSYEKLSHFSLALPPSAEQERIVAKLSSALSPIERAESAVLRALERLKRYRTSVLEAAVVGQLTGTWRKADQEPRTSDTTGETLLRSLQATRRARWEEAEVRRLRQKRRGPGDELWKTRYQDPPPPNTADLPDLPDTWAWASLEMVAEIGSGISVSRNRVLKDPIELPYLRVANVLRGHLDLSDVKTMRVEKDRAADYVLQVGDILFNEGGDRDKLGRGWVWEGQIARCVHQNHVFRVRLIDSSLLSPKFVSHWGNTFGQLFFLRHATQTTNLASINRGVLAKLPIPIAPRTEQAEILREVDLRIKAADRLATVVEEQLARAQTARRTLLQQAFAGGLSTQDPSDEPAAALTEQMRAKILGGGGPTANIRPASKSRGKMKSTQPRSLLLVLEETAKPMTPEELFQAAGHSQESVDEFFAELRELTTPPARISEERIGGRVTLRRVVS